VNYRKLQAAQWLSVLVVGASLATVMPSSAAPPHRRRAPAKSVGTGRAAVLATVNQFEQAYKRKDKKTLLMKLMVPTSDAGALENGYQWLRGYGPTDMPGTRHPPILLRLQKVRSCLLLTRFSPAVRAIPAIGMSPFGSRARSRRGRTL